MSTPVGHTLFGLTLARRLGVTSSLGLGATVVAASLPDIDVIAGILLHRDPWKLHRRGTHTLGFAVTAGALAGVAGALSSGSADGERDLIADALTGAAIVGSHIVLDKAWFPYLSAKKGMSPPRFLAMHVFNWALDGALYGALAWWLWPRRR